MKKSDVKLGPGTQLKQAREAAGKTVEDAANYLHLTTQVVQTIEADRYQDRKEAIPFTFVRGYLRSYAKYLQLNADDLVKAFDRLNLIEPGTGRPALSMVRKPVSIKFSVKRYLSYFMLGLGILLTIVWWHNRRATTLQTADNAPWVEVETHHKSSAGVKDESLNNLSSAVKSMTA